MKANQYGLLAVTGLAAITFGGFALVRGEPAADPATAPTLGPLYAAPVERVETHVLGAGQTLSALLARASITGDELTNLLFGLRQYINPRRLPGGVEITVRRWTRTQDPRAIDVRVNQDSTLHLFRDETGWNGRYSVTPTVLDTVYASGAIDAGRTLYEAIVYDEDSTLPAGERIQLVYELAEIYEYKLDFRVEIQPGDRYRLVYEREARPDGTARRRRILAAEIENGSRVYPAIWFNRDEVSGYYDEEGRPLRTGFSRYPVNYRITSNFNPRRYHPVLGTTRAHLGTDFGAPRGTPVGATADGTVVFAGVNGGYGNLVRIRHMNGYETRYAHLSRFASGIRAGTRVKQKQIIGYVGATGLATGPHLHYELRRNGQAINVRTARLPDAPPLEAKYLEEFKGLVGGRLALLDVARPQPAIAGVPVTPDHP